MLHRLPRGRRRLLAGPLAVLALGALAFGLFAGLGGATSTASTPLVSTDPAVIANGEYLFNVHCSSCHGPHGVGTDRAPELYNAGAAAADFYLITGRMPLDVPTQQADSHAPYFSSGQIQALVSYVAALPRIDKTNTGPGIPSVLPLCPQPKKVTASGTQATRPSTQPNCVTLAYGQETFALNCEQCHQAAGAGGMLSRGDVIPSLQNLYGAGVMGTAPEVVAAEAMRVGPKPMPVFGPGQLNERQLSAVAHYVTYLDRGPDNAGGLGISNFGPVAEGFVAIIIGFGFLLFLSRMIGTRA